MATKNKSRTDVLHSPIYYFGGKGMMRSRIVPILESIDHKVYVEPFGGGASLLLAKSPAPITVYNDLDTTVYSFWSILKDATTFEAFNAIVNKLPYSRELYYHCRDTWQSETDPIWRAVKWFVKNKQAFIQETAKSGWAFNKKSPTRINNVKFSLSIMEAVHKRLQSVELYNTTWQSIIDLYDSPSTLFYLDPPYIKDTRRSGGYAHEMNNSDHKQLVESILTCKGTVVLSGYEHSVYAPLLDNGYTIQRTKTVAHGTQKKTERIECLYISPTTAQQGE